MICDGCRYFDEEEWKCTKIGEDLTMIRNRWNCQFRKPMTGKQKRERKKKQNEDKEAKL